MMWDEAIKNRWCLLLLVTLSVLALSQCTWDGYQHATIGGDSTTRTHVLYNTPKIQSLVKQVLLAKEEHRKGLASPDRNCPVVR